MRKVLISLCVAVALAMAGAPALAEEVGASGQCYDSDGNGGEDAASVNTDGDVTAPTVTGAVDALATFGDGFAANPGGDACTGDDAGDDGKDYIEGHAGPAQACYDKDGFVVKPGANAPPRDCPTHPAQDDEA